MASYRTGLTQAQLKRLMVYNPISGAFLWRETRGRVRKGAVGGRHNTTGNVQIKIMSHEYCATRLAYLYMTGKWPRRNMRHINGIPDDNRWCNLSKGPHT